MINQVSVGKNPQTTTLGRAAFRPPQSGSADSYEPGPRQTTVQVSPSTLNTPEFQRKLAEYALAGVAVNVEMVPDKPALVPTLDAAPPVAPATAPQPPASPVAARSRFGKISRALVQGYGAATAVSLGVVSAGLGALGALICTSAIAEGLGPMLGQLGQHGTMGALTTAFLAAGALGKAAAVFGAVSAGAGGGMVGLNLGKTLAKLAIAPTALAVGGHSELSALLAVGKKPARPLGAPEPLTSGLLPVAMASGLAGGFMGGISFLQNGELLSHSLSLAHLSTSSILAGGAGAAALGMMGAFGAYRLLNSASQLIDAQLSKSTKP